MTDDMARVQIQEFWNPKITAESSLTGTNVDVRKEQEKILLRKIDRFIKPMSQTLKGKTRCKLLIYTDFLFMNLEPGPNEYK